MWKENDEVLRVLDGDVQENIFPLICPECGKEAVHIYFHRFDEDDEYGAGWVWCSECKSYAHMRYQIPKWWRNLEILDEDLLEDSPEYLERFRERIDELYESSSR